MTFYSPDRPAPFRIGETWGAGLTSLEDARRTGFIAVCDASDARLPACTAAIAAAAPNAERIDLTVRRQFRGAAGPELRWQAYLVPPAR
jgi:hypothetical protein